MLTAAGSQPDSQITAPVDRTPKYPRSSEAQTGCLILSFLSCCIGKPGLRKTSHYFDHSVQISEHKEEIGIFISFLKSQTQPCVHTRCDMTLVFRYLVVSLCTDTPDLLGEVRVLALILRGPARGGSSCDRSHRSHSTKDPVLSICWTLLHCKFVTGLILLF